MTSSGRCSFSRVRSSATCSSAEATLLSCWVRCSDSSWRSSCCRSFAVLGAVVTPKAILRDVYRHRHSYGGRDGRRPPTPAASARDLLGVQNPCDLPNYSDRLEHPLAGRGI